MRALYLEAGVADVAAETGDAELLRVRLTRWDDMVATKTYLTGGDGSRHSGESFGDRFELPPDRAYNETCAAIASFQWSWRLLLATGDGRYADLMERVLYNGFACAIATGGTRFFYVNPLQRRADHFEDDDPGRRREWFTCACCPPNIMRLVRVAGALPRDGVAETSCTCISSPGRTLSASLAGGILAVDMVTDYPWSGQVTLRVTSAPPRRLRPGDAGSRPGPNAAISAERCAPWRRPQHGYLVIRRRWRPGDVIRATRRRPG